MLPAGEEASPEHVVLTKLQRADLWREVLQIAKTIPERIVLIESYIYNLPPRAILRRHPQVFGGVPHIYSTKRYLFERLQRSQALSRFREEYLVCS